MDTNTKNVPANALCDTKGRPFLFPVERLGVGGRMVVLIREYLDRNYDLVATPDGQYLVPVNPDLERELTAFERVAVETLVWHCRKYTQGLRRDASVTFPKLIHCGSDEAVTAECESLGFDDEARAYMFAEVAGYCFPVDAEVIETPAGWGVVVSCDHRGIDENVVSQLQGACQVLMHYAVDLDNEADALECLHHNPAPAAREAWRSRKNAQQQRIEDGINAILAHLGHPTATPAAAEAHAADPHIRTVKSKSSGKEKKAKAVA